MPPRDPGLHGPPPALPPTPGDVATGLGLVAMIAATALVTASCAIRVGLVEPQLKRIAFDEGRLAGACDEMRAADPSAMLDAALAADCAKARAGPS